MGYFQGGGSAYKRRRMKVHRLKVREYRRDAVRDECFASTNEVVDADVVDQVAGCLADVLDQVAGCVADHVAEKNAEGDVAEETTRDEKIEQWLDGCKPVDLQLEVDARDAEITSLNGRLLKKNKKIRILTSELEDANHRLQECFQQFMKTPRGLVMSQKAKTC